VVFGYCILELGCGLFDFTWARVRKNRAQGIRTKVIGKRWFVCLNVIACLLRLSFWLYKFDAGFEHQVFEHICDISTSLGSLVFGLIAVALMTLLIASLTVLKTDSPIVMRALANTKARSLAQSTPRPTPALAEHELFSTLSLARPAPTSSAQVGLSAGNEGAWHTSRVSAEPTFGQPTCLQAPFHEVPDPQAKEVPMDWEPSPGPDLQASNDILLRPQTFLPPPPFREETGIEELFQTQAKLVDAHPSLPRPAGWLQHLLSLKSSLKKE